MRSILFLASLASLAPGLAPPAAAQVGSVLRSQRINTELGGFGGALDDYDYFGNALAALGDLDGDGVGDLAVAADSDDDGGHDRGAIWILFLNADGTVRDEQKISQTEGGFGGTLADSAHFGQHLAAVGDLDGDGRTELAALSRLPSRLWILFLAADGTVTTTRENLFTDPVFGPGSLPEHFRYGGLAALDDRNGDGLGDLLIGAAHDSDGFLRAGAVWIANLGADGALLGAHKISQTQGGFGGTLYEGGWFGMGVVQMGDLDGDGRREIGVHSPYGPPFGGTLWVLYLDAAEQVASEVGFGPGYEYGLAFPNNSFYPSSSNGWLGDIDGDGDGEIAIGFPHQNYPGGLPNEGVIAIGSVASDAGIQRKVRISYERGGLGHLPRNTQFGFAFAPLGDLDGNGAHELAVGAPADRDAAGVHTGGVWILTLDPSAVRNGSGTNPVTLSGGDPFLGLPWQLQLDCSAHAPGIAIVFGRSAPLAPTPTPFGELLLGGQALFTLQAAHVSDVALLQMIAPPPDAALIDLPLHLQGVCTGAPGTRLGNALDLIVGRW